MPRRSRLAAALCLMRWATSSIAFTVNVPSCNANLQGRRNAGIGSSAADCCHPFARHTVFRARCSQMAVGQGSLDSHEDHDNSYRSRLRHLTGFSLTAFRAMIRTVTGVSLSAVYASALAMSGAWIRWLMATVLGIFPAWVRYFAQPFLVLYYVPLLLLRGAAGPTRRDARRAHERFVDSWKKAVALADGSTQYWPLHVDSQGKFVSDLPELDLKEAIAESSFLSMELTEKSRQEQEG